MLIGSIIILYQAKGFYIFCMEKRKKTYSIPKIFRCLVNNLYEINIKFKSENLFSQRGHAKKIRINIIILSDSFFIIWRRWKRNWPYQIWRDIMEGRSCIKKNYFGNLQYKIKSQEKSCFIALKLSPSLKNLDLVIIITIRSWDCSGLQNPKERIIEYQIRIGEGQTLDIGFRLHDKQAKKWS